MKVKKLYLAYFSATETTKQSVEAIASALDIPEKEVVDFTSLKSRQKGHHFEKDSLVIFGMPVYYGRVIAVQEELMKHITSDGALAVPVVIYGNRAYEDALLELTTLLKDCGMKPIAGVAGIGEHSFQIGLAAGRPDQDDLGKMKAFGAEIAAKLEKMEAGEEVVAPEVPGNVPYRAGGSMPLCPTTDENCIKCGLCAQGCPMEAIPLEDPTQTDPERCILCFYCVKYCPTHARAVRDEGFQQRMVGLNQMAGATRKEPELYL